MVLVHRDAGWLKHHLLHASLPQAAVDEIVRLPILSHLSPENSHAPHARRLWVASDL